MEKYLTGLYDLIENGQSDKFYIELDKINASDYEFFKVTKNEILEISYCIWTILSEFPVYFKDFDENYISVMEQIMKKCYDCFQEKYKNDIDFLWIFGFFIEMFPENFLLVNDDYLDMEENGKKFIKQAYEMNSNLAPAIYFATDREDTELLKSAREYMKENFTENTGLYEYFVGVQFAEKE